MYAVRKIAGAAGIISLFFLCPRSDIEAQLVPGQLESIESESPSTPEKVKHEEVRKSPAEEKPVVKGDQSTIEKMYNERFIDVQFESLTQYGYDFFKKFQSEKHLPVGDQYVVGPGDTVVIYFWGAPVTISKMKGFYTMKVDRDGKIFIPELGVFYVWGATVNEIKGILDNAMASKFRSYELDVTLGPLREFPVYVSGFVKRPGMVLTMGTGTILDVLALSGGVDKSGSLRKITIKRVEKGESKSISIDLYNLLIRGNPVNTLVRDGDTIYVNPVYATAGIAGGVKRAAIYELDNQKTTVRDLIYMAGGVLPSVHSPGIKLYRYSKDTLQILQGRLGDDAFMDQVLQAGDYVTVENLYNLVENEILVRGHVSYTGKYSYTPGMKLSDILSKVGMLPDTNKQSGGIWRDKSNTVINFNPQAVLERKSDVELFEKDIIIFYPKRLYEPIQVMGEVDNPSVVQYHPGITLLEVLKSITFTQPAQDLKAEIFFTENGAQRSMSIYMNELMVGGEKDANIVLQPGSRVLIKLNAGNERKKSVTVLGRINKPGVYDFRQGLRLYDLLVMAGGYSPNAYPRGLILVRNSAKKLQEEHIKITFLSMKEQMGRQSEKMASIGSSPEERAMLQMTVARYEQMLDIMKKKSELALGRIAMDVPVGLEDLKNDPDNIILVDGDYVYVPEAPHYVLILGDVYNQMSLPYDAGKTVEYYLNQLGGLAENADRNNIYIIKANGKIISKKQYSSLKNLFFSIDWGRRKINVSQDFFSLRLEQGDTIVVPSELKVPMMWRPILRDIAQIMFQTMSTVILATRL